MWSTLALVSSVATVVNGAATQVFTAPAPCAVCTSSNYVGTSNGSLPISSKVPGLVYDRFIQIWLENTDYSAAAASATFQKLAAQGILLQNYNGVTHPSEPNYVASIMGDFFGMPDDGNYYLPSNVSTMVDLLEAKNVSWATYQENMPYDAFAGDYASKNYINTSAPAYTYYKRKHNPFIIANSIASVEKRAARIRNFNDFAVDVNASAIPQYVYVTPNLVNDAHDTDVTFVSAWLEYWLVPLLANKNFNDNRTLILLTFDENESYGIQNTVYSVLLGGAVSKYAGQTDSTYYTHYSGMSSVQNNWGLGSLGRQDTNKTVSAVFQFQANQTNYTNYVPQTAEIPYTNLTGIFPGVCNVAQWIAVPAPNITAVGAGGGKVFYTNTTNTATTFNSMTAVNLTALGIVNPITINPNYTYPALSNNTATSTSSNTTTSATPSATKASAGSKIVALGGLTVGALVLGSTLLL